MLKDILKKCAKETGISLTSALQKASLVDDINSAARELYNATDLLDSLDEDVFDFYEDNENQVALPWYIDHVRGMRNFDGRYAIDLEDPKNRYYHGLNTEIWSLRFRKKHESALSRDISNQSRITFRILQEEASDIIIAIVGKTTNAAQRTETVILAAGQLEVETANQYVSPIQKISKNRVTDNDVIIEDINDNELGTIPNHLLGTKYTVFQVIDDISAQITESAAAIEVLYKKRFIPMVNDEDEFQCGDRYDDAIYWKFMENRAKTPIEANILHGKCNKIINNILDDAKNGIRERINFVPGPYFRIHYKCT